MQVNLGVKADGQDYKPQQVFLALRHKKTGIAAYAVGKAKKDGSYTLTTTASSIEKQIGKLVR